MKKRILKIFVVVISLLLIVTIYINSSFFIEKQEWKYEEGTHIGDWLNKSNLDIKDGIIYSYDGRAKIVFSFGFELIIENIDTNEKGFYVNKS